MPLGIASAATEADPALVAGTRVSVDRARALPAPKPEQVDTGGDANENIVDVAFEPVSVFAAPPPSTTPVADAAELVIATLLSERRAAQGDYSHPHTPGDCPFCRRAAAAYR
ncbi:MAG TPA: hypothetical protein VMU50_21295 [Polyangia bacterium]|nr:hypothetical protein [Polyangia bacterium]